MQVIVVADEAAEEEIRAKKISAGVDMLFLENFSEVWNYGSAGAFFLLKENISIEDYKVFGEKPVFINSTIHTLKELNLPENFSRINGWPGFLKRETWEIATMNEDLVKDIFERSGWKYITVADEPGMVAARIISMIINEAYFALGENVSSKDEIDLAMKLGTNYPYGPLEWSRKIGLKRIYNLLKKLSETDERYRVASQMKNDLQNS